MKHVHFTQFLAPHGRPVDRWVAVEDKLAEIADQLIAQGLRFECEVLSTGEVSLTLTHPEDGDLIVKVVPNGPEVLTAVADLIKEGATR